MPSSLSSSHPSFLTSSLPPNPLYCLSLPPAPLLSFRKGSSYDLHSSFFNHVLLSSHSQNTGGFYKCNRFDAIKTDGSTSAAQKAKAELERYLHYYQRFHGHDSALKFAAGQREAAERRMVERQEAQRSTWIDVQFLKHAAEQVIDCRRVLKYSYALGYFLENDSLEKQLFEHHQELLEKNTEKLHEYTEQSLDVIDRTQVPTCIRTHLY